MTAAGLQNLAGAAPEAKASWPPPAWLHPAGLRLVRLHLASRRVPAALAALAVCGVVMWAALYWHWVLGSGTGAQSVPIVLEAGTASVVAVTTSSPFGELERAGVRWLPWLRLGTAVALAGAAVGALCAGAAITGDLSGGTLGVLRNVAGLTGIGLLAAAVTGGGLAWIAPMAYMVAAQYAIIAGWTTPWLWPARPPADHGAALCAALVLAAGVAVTAFRGARDPASGD